MGAGRLGVLESLTGTLQTRAIIQATGRWDESTQTIFFQEDYQFDDGHSDSLEWRIKRLSLGNYSGAEAA